MHAFEKYSGVYHTNNKIQYKVIQTKCAGNLCFPPPNPSFYLDTIKLTYKFYLPTGIHTEYENSFLYHFELTKISPFMYRFLMSLKRHFTCFFNITPITVIFNTIVYIFYIYLSISFFVDLSLHLLPGYITTSSLFFLWRLMYSCFAALK